MAFFNGRHVRPMGWGGLEILPTPSQQVLMDCPFEKEISAAAAKHGLDPALVAAVAFVESRFQPGALRYERKFQKKYIDCHPKYHRLDPKTRALLSSSLGLLQVMGATAHEDGLALMRLGDLLTPETGLEYGCLQLAQLRDRYKNSPPERQITDVVAAYNAGTVRIGDKGGYTNQGYVDKVMKKYLGFKRTA